MHELVREQELPAPIERVFAFFERPENLEAITPPFLHFRITTPGPCLIERGALIDYRLRLHGVPIRWRTRIAEYEPPRMFVDEQLHGPYRVWVHTHTFEPTRSDGTLMRDRVRYELPRVPFRGWINRWLVEPDLARIFDFRGREIARLLARGRGL